jgi:SAM-dependent methyltransferase
MSVNLREREAEEVIRSRQEALAIGNEPLDGVYKPRNVQRYINPPANALHALEYAYHLLNHHHDKTILDLGCGTGENTALLSLRGGAVVGMDLSVDLVSLARRRMRMKGLPGELLAGSAHALPFRDNSFDVVFGAAILHHLDLDLAAREIRRVLKPEGIGVFVEPLRDSASLRVLRKLIPARRERVSPHESPLTIRQVRRFSGLMEMQAERFFTMPTSRILEMAGVRGELPARFDRWLLGAFPPLRKYATGIVFSIRRNGAA